MLSSNTMSFQLTNEGIEKSSNAASTTDADQRRTSDNSSSSDENNNMFTKFAFPFKLHSILESSGTSGQENIISWLPSGKAFKIHKPKEFADVIMPQYFNQTKYRSFQRQLYIYGFDRIKDKSSEDYGAYFHELFIRGASDLCLDMQRKKIKGTGLSNEERRKKANALRANSKASPNKNSLKTQQMNTSQQAPIQTPSSQSIYATLGLNSFTGQLQQSTPGQVTPPEWNSANAAAVLKNALQVQEIATRRDNLNNLQKSLTNNNAVSLPQYNKMNKRCSLGFVRSGRRGSFLTDGDEVGFGDRKFFFTTDY